VGGLVKNPYALDRSPGGSSSGTGAAVAASLAAAGVGTETDGSITCPASFAGLAGLKPTLGLVSRTLIVPISHSQDTAGPMGRCVADIAALLTAMAGSDPADPATAEADARRVDYVAALDGASLAGRRLGVPGYAAKLTSAVDAVFAEALALLRAEGAEVVEVSGYEPPEDLGRNEFTVLLCDLKADLNAYLATTPIAVKARTLADVIAFNAATPRETLLFGQDTFERAEATLGPGDPAYAKARAECLRATRAEGIDRLLGEHRLDALIAPSYAPAPRVDVVSGDFRIGRSPGRLAAIAGYPHLTVPMGQVRGLPVGLSFMGPAWSEASLLAMGHAFEAAAQARRAPTYAASLESSPEFEAAAAPAR
jgi:amidase